MNASAVAARSLPNAVRPIGAFLVAAALVLAFVLRLAFAFGYWVGKPLTLDEQEYLQLGTSLANGQGLKYTGTAASRHFERPPGFAAFVAGVRIISGVRGATSPPPGSSSDVPAPLKVAQSLLGVLGVGLVAAIAAQAAGRAAAVTAAFLAAIYPPLVWICGYVLSEPLYSALALGVVWILQAAERGWATRRDSREGAAGNGRARLFGYVLLAGVTAGAAVLTKEAMVFFVPLAPLEDPALAAPAILQALGFAQSGHRTPLEQLVEHLGARQVLIVLDNFEQVMDAAPLVGEWLRVVRADDGWQETLDGWDVHLVLVEPKTPLVYRLEVNGWQKLYSDEVAVVYGR